MMDEGSASSEPDVGVIDLSSHLSGRRRSGATRHEERFQHNVPLDTWPRTFRRIYIQYLHPKYFKWPMILSHQQRRRALVWNLVLSAEHNGCRSCTPRCFYRSACKVASTCLTSSLILFNRRGLVRLLLCLFCSGDEVFAMCIHLEEGDVFVSREQVFLSNCQRVHAPSSPLSSKLRPSLCSRLCIFFSFAHWVFIINVNNWKDTHCSSLSSHL